LIQVADRASISVGSVRLDGRAFLAPMSGVTDVGFRRIARRFGASLVVSEMVACDDYVRGDAESRLRAEGAGVDPHVVQIAGCDARWMGEAARLAEASGAAIVDINMGCPAKRVVAGECGSALMREPAIAQELIRAVVDALPTTVPVTVKHRAGWNHDNRNAAEFACAMVEAGAQMITVHGRTRTQGFSGKSDPEVIRLVRDALPSHIPLVGNGDVIDVEGYLRLREQTGCDAVMIGRGALGNPWLFARLREVAAGRPDPGPPGLDERLAVFRRHVDLIETLKQGPRMLHEVRKSCAWYARGLYGCNALRLRVWEAPDIAAARALVEDYFAQLIERQRRLGLSPEGERGEMDGSFSGDEAA